MIVYYNGGNFVGQKSKLFGEEKIGKLLFRFSIPIIISILISELYNMVDTFFIGRSVGGDGIGALVLVFPVQRIIIALSMMIAIGTSSSFSRSNGEENFEKSKKILKTGFSLIISIMLIITTLIFFFKEKVLLGLGSSVDILPYAKEYLGIIIFGSLFLSLTIFISNILVSLGNNKIAIKCNSIGAILNIILDYILVVHLEMGVTGAGIATVSSQIAGFSFAYYNFLKIKREHNISSGFYLDRKIIISIILIGLSAFVVEAEDGIVMGVFNNLLLDSVGDSGIVVLGVISKIYMFLFITMFGIASAMQPIAAYNIGARNFKRLKSIMQKTILFSSLTTGVMWGIAMAFPSTFISLFIDDVYIIKESVHAFRVMIALFPFISIYYVSIFYFQAMGRGKISLGIAIFRQLLIMLPLSIVLVKWFNLGAMGVWISYPISDFLASVGSFILIRNESLKLNLKIKKQSKKTNLEKGFVLD